VLRCMGPFESAWPALVDPRHPDYSTLADADLAESTRTFLAGHTHARGLELAGTTYTEASAESGPAAVAGGRRAAGPARRRGRAPCRRWGRPSAREGDHELLVPGSPALAVARAALEAGLLHRRSCGRWADAMRRAATRGSLSSPVPGTCRSGFLGSRSWRIRVIRTGSRHGSWRCWGFVEGCSNRQIARTLVISQQRWRRTWSTSWQRCGHRRAPTPPSGPNARGCTSRHARKKDGRNER
jgi:hypothetical protein